MIATFPLVSLSLFSLYSQLYVRLLEKIIMECSSLKKKVIPTNNKIY